VVLHRGLEHLENTPGTGRCPGTERVVAGNVDIERLGELIGAAGTVPGETA
jgi:hypothetical protein